MDQKVMERAELLIRNRDVVKKCFSMGNGLTYLSGAAIYTMHDREATVEEIKAARAIIKAKVSVFSEIRGGAVISLVCLAAIQPDPEAYIDKALQAYHSLRSQFFPSPYLPLAAFTMAQNMPLEDFDPLSEKAKALYQLFKQKHAFLINSTDSPMCLLMAMEDRDPDDLLADIETCYQILKTEFFSKDAVQSLAQVLALCPGEPEDKCAKTMALYNGLKDAGIKYGTSYELATLGGLALSGEDFDTIIRSMGEVDQWLSKQKGFGILSMISAKHRLMFAGMLVQLSCDQTDLAQTMALNSTITIVVQEELILYAIMASVAASSAAAAGGSH